MYVNWAQTMNLHCIHVWNGKLYNLIHSLVHPFTHSYLFFFFFNVVTPSVHLYFSFLIVEFDFLYCIVPGFPVLHYLPEFAQTHAHWVGDAISTISFSVTPFSSCPQSFPASGSFPMSQSLQQVPEGSELQPQHQSFQWIFRVDFL